MGKMKVENLPRLELERMVKLAVCWQKNGEPVAINKEFIKYYDQISVEVEDKGDHFEYTCKGAK